MIGDDASEVRVYGFERTLVSQFTLPITVQFFFVPDGCVFYIVFVCLIYIPAPDTNF